MMNEVKNEKQVVNNSKIVMNTQEKEANTSKNAVDVNATSNKTSKTKEDPINESNKIMSDSVMIEIVRAFRDIAIEYIHRKYH